jgi:hypothetical protein
MSVYKAITAVQAELSKEGISKARKNDQQGYKFRGIDDVYNALAPILAAHGLCILPRCTERICVERTNANGKALFYVTVRAEFDFVCAEDGSKHTVTTYGEAMDSGDKATNKAMSAAYKYAAMQAFSIPTEGDNDADATTHDVKPATALDLFSPHHKAMIRKAAAASIEEFNKGNDWSAYEEVDSCADKIAAGDSDTRNNALRAFGEIFKDESALRASIKQHMQAARAKETA